MPFDAPIPCSRSREPPNSCKRWGASQGLPARNRDSPRFSLADRVRGALKGKKGVTEKNMFGGVCFLLRGNMLCGTATKDFMFRVGKEQDAKALSRNGARPMDFTGKVMKGFVWVDPRRCDARALKNWIAMAEKYVGKLPAKGKK